MNELARAAYERRIQRRRNPQDPASRYESQFGISPEAAVAGQPPPPRPDEMARAPAVAPELMPRRAPSTQLTGAVPYQAEPLDELGQREQAAHQMIREREIRRLEFRAKHPYLTRFASQFQHPNVAAAERDAQGASMDVAQNYASAGLPFPAGGFTGTSMMQRETYTALQQAKWRMDAEKRLDARMLSRARMLKALGIDASRLNEELLSDWLMAEVPEAGRFSEYPLNEEPIERIETPEAVIWRDPRKGTIRRIDVKPYGEPEIWEGRPELGVGPMFRSGPGTQWQAAPRLPSEGPSAKEETKAWQKWRANSVAWLQKRSDARKFYMQELEKAQTEKEALEDQLRALGPDAEVLEPEQFKDLTSRINKAEVAAEKARIGQSQIDMRYPRPQAPDESWAEDTVEGYPGEYGPTQLPGGEQRGEAGAAASLLASAGGPATPGLAPPDYYEAAIAEFTNGPISEFGKRLFDFVNQELGKGHSINQVLAWMEPFVHPSDLEQAKGAFAEAIRQHQQSPPAAAPPAAEAAQAPAGEVAPEQAAPTEPGADYDTPNQARPFEQYVEYAVGRSDLDDYATLWDDLYDMALADGKNDEEAKAIATSALEEAGLEPPAE